MREPQAVAKTRGGSRIHKPAWNAGSASQPGLSGRKRCSQGGGSRIMPREPASQAGYRGRRCSPPSPMQAIKTSHHSAKTRDITAAAPPRQCRRLRPDIAVSMTLVNSAAAPPRQCRRLRLLRLFWTSRSWVAAAPPRQCRRLRPKESIICFEFSFAAAPPRQCRRLRRVPKLPSSLNAALQPPLANAGD